MLIAEASQLDDFLGALKKRMPVFDVRKNILPVKQYFLPPVEEIFYADKKGKIMPAKKPKEFVVFGLDLIELEAIVQLDEIMRKPSEDFFYFQRRNQAVLIGLTDGKTEAPAGGDIIFEKINDRQYQISVLTKKGEGLAKKYRRLFRATERSGTAVRENSISEWSKSMRALLLDSETLSEAVKWSRNHKIWDELKEKCLGCGICVYVCPLCYCFSIEDSVGLNGECRRCRKWDACFLPAFSRIAGGHSFRPTLKERYYNWFYHKFVRAYKEYGKSQCVGCERCKIYCPAKIDIQEILLKILEDYQR